MKRIVLFLLFAVLGGYVVDAQTNCAVKHRIFKAPAKGKTPQTIKKLGSDPQFIPVRRVASQATMFRGLKALGKNARYKKEINSLFRAAGYTGVRDVNFTSDKLIKTTLPFGTIGMLGDGKHSYLYSILTLTGIQKIKCWKIEAINGGCSFYIMNECGNAFYRTGGPAIAGEGTIVAPPPPPPAPTQVELPPPAPEKVFIQAPAKETDLKLSIYARYRYNSCDCCNPKAVYNKPVYVDKQMLIDEKQYNNINNVEGATEKETITKEVYVDVDKAAYKKLQKSAKAKQKAEKKMQEKAAKEAAKASEKAAKDAGKSGSSRSAQ